MPTIQANLLPVGTQAAADPLGNDDVCIVVPMLNEASSVGRVVEGLRTVFPHIVCVDDGSSDASAEEAVGSGAVVVRHPVNLGQGAAIQTGVEYALAHLPRARFLVTFDSDGQHRVEDALALLEEARHGDHDVVLGSRFLRGQEGIPLGRRLLLRGAVLFTRATTGLALTDAHNGLRVFSRRAASMLDIRLHGMAHASEILATLARYQLSYCEVPVEVLYTEYSRGKGQPAINAVNVVFDLLVERLRTA